MHESKFSNRILRSSLIALVAVVAAFGAKRDATINTVLTITNATGTIGASGVTFAGQASLTNIGSGTLSGTLPIVPQGNNFVGTLAIALAGGDRINMSITIPTSVLTAGTFTGSATVTGGTGTYAGATGAFPSLTGTFSLTSGTLNATGSGTINTGGTVGPTPPTITDVLDAGSYTDDIAQGSIFVVKGTELSGSGVSFTSFPLPTTSGGVRITFTPTSGGAGTDAFLVYLFNQGGVNQLAAILPSSVAPGNYNVTVTKDGTASAPFAVRVVQRKPGIITADSTGSGLAVVQNFVSQSQLDINRFTTFASGGFTFSPAKPGQTLILYVVGLGPVTGGDNTASAGFNFLANGVTVEVIVGGVSITPQYAGRVPGGAGYDQINFALPPNVPTGCVVPLTVVVNGQRSVSTFIAIAPDSGSTVCSQTGFTTAELQRFDQGGSFTIGGFGLTQFTQTVPQLGNIKVNSAAGSFIRYTGAQLAGLIQARAQTTSSGQCFISRFSTADNETPPLGSIIGLDAGNLTLSGPAGSNLSNTPFTKETTFNTYSINLGTEGLPVQVPGSVNANLVAGTYRIDGAGGRDVGAFNASVALGAPLVITGGLPTTINRGVGLQLNWTGGNPSDLVQISGNSSARTGNVTETVTFVCTTTAGAGGFLVPTSILSQLPASTVTQGIANGFIGVTTGTVSNFTAPLTAGGNIDAGSFAALIGSGAIAAYQ